MIRYPFLCVFGEVRVGGIARYVFGGDTIELVVGEYSLSLELFHLHRVVVKE